MDAILISEHVIDNNGQHTSCACLTKRYSRSIYFHHTLTQGYTYRPVIRFYFHVYMFVVEDNYRLGFVAAMLIAEHMIDKSVPTYVYTFLS